MASCNFGDEKGGRRGKRQAGTSFTSGRGEGHGFEKDGDVRKRGEQVKQIKGRSSCWRWGGILWLSQALHVCRGCV
jgi:hypothetical protein